jgi:hypothetical protein
VVVVFDKMQTAQAFYNKWRERQLEWSFEYTPNTTVVVTLPAVSKRTAHERVQELLWLRGE